MANRARGFITAKIGERSVDLCLGLGVLAELEDAFGVESFEEALDFGDRISAKRMALFMGAVLKGNGVVLDEELSRAVRSLTMPDFMAIVMELLVAAGLKEVGEAGDGAKSEGPLVKKPAEKSAGGSGKK